MLRYWEDTGAFRPEYVRIRETGPFRKIYSFRDLVTLRTLAALRTKHDVGLDELRRASKYLSDYSDAPWTQLKIRLLGKKVVFLDPRTGEWSRADGSGQLVMTIDLGRVSQESEAAARKLMQREPADYGRVTRNRYVMSNAWVFAGTRIPLEAVTDLHGAGMSVEAILAEYPTLRPQDIDAALAFVPPVKAA
jgi:uncharacterized protein (DUF433 family)